jgi:probable 2-oxoglutarate dehydrogenase E1 component DHKTD1
VQEEPRNQGSWTHVEGRAREVLRAVKGRETALVYRGRRESAIPATGTGRIYQAQQREVLEGAFRKL